YHYIPSQPVAIIMLVLFGLATLIHLGLATKYRLFWLFPTVCLCGLGEVIGWSGRLWSSINPIASDPFEMQITCTIIAPTPFLAANFIIFGDLIRRLGFKYSRLNPKWYSIIFCSCDVVSLVVQAAGGAIASGNSLQSSITGAHIMIGGIAIQLVVIVFFSLFALEYFVRYFYDRPVRVDWAKLEASSSTTLTGLGEFRGKLTTRRKVMSCALAFTTLLLFIRAIYRLIELSDGWRGRIISNELYFNVLDATMIVIVMYTALFIHPGHFLSEPASSEKYDVELKTPGQI
ncbi:RTA1-like protein, partial [Agrocybe pediades]